MKRKPKEKLSDRLENLFLKCVKSYTRSYYDSLLRTIPDNKFDENDTSYTAKVINKEAAKAMTGIVMDTISEYEPEDIE